MLKFINSVIAIIWWFYTLPSRYVVERRSSLKYKKKKEIVKKIWMVSGIIISVLLQNPFFLGAAMVVALFTTFLGLTILDETE